MADTLRAGVIGAGVFGGYHAEKWLRLDGARLTAIYDTHPENAHALAKRVGGEAFTDLAAFLDAVDLASIATPAVSHGSCALRALEAGKHIYIEKPLAVTLNDADAIVTEAARRQLVVACGFSERVALEALGLWTLRERPVLVEATRMGAPSPRNQDVSVVLDLMIHDIDLVLALSGAAALTVEAEGRFGPAASLDTAIAEITFESGMVARLTASRVALAATRTMRLTYSSGVIDIDLIDGRVETSTIFRLNADFAATPLARDRLGASVSKFLSAVRGEGSCYANAEDGARALDLALAVETAVSA